jgi:tRNA-2-methylthio-N6-dimethylallyladenosine synthase
VNQRKFYIETYGCQMNDHDSEKMAAMLEDMGYCQVFGSETADVVIINTCSIREKAEHKVYSALGALRSLKAQNPNLITVVAGCVAQQEKVKLLRRVSHLDVVLGTHHIGDLPDVLRSIEERRSRTSRVDFCDDVESLHLPAPHRGNSPICTFVTIMQGCSNFCAYCVVPYTRGPEQSRPSAEIIEEVSNLVDRGVKEVTLLGQNVNAYGNDQANGGSFADLLLRLDRIAGLERIRFTTSHPRDFTEALASAMADLKSVCEHIHLPMQSGSDPVLTRMRRGYSFGEYFEKIRLLRQKSPNVAITSDLIVGFPGETEEDFERSLDALRWIRFDQIFSFKYSARPQTAAKHFKDHIPEEIKVERLAKVHAVQESITRDYHDAAVETTEEVLVEGIRESNGQAHGRTRTNKIVNINLSGPVKLGDLVMVKITRGLKHSLVGEEACALEREETP